MGLLASRWHGVTVASCTSRAVGHDAFKPTASTTTRHREPGAAETSTRSVPAGERGLPYSRFKRRIGRVRGALAGRTGTSGSWEHRARRRNMSAYVKALERTPKEGAEVPVTDAVGAIERVCGGG